MTSRYRYYIVRALVSAAFGIVFALAGLPWWGALIVAVGAFVLFLWAPRSGRYLVQPEGGAAPLRHDERTAAIRNQAARNGFAGIMLALAAATLYFGLIAPGDLPVGIPSLTLALGAVIYFVSDHWLRRP
jgi:hypothetical protein